MTGEHVLQLLVPLLCASKNGWCRLMHADGMADHGLPRPNGTFRSVTFSEASSLSRFCSRGASTDAVASIEQDADDGHTHTCTLLL